MQKPLALTLTVAILMASGFGFTPPAPPDDPARAGAAASPAANPQVSNAALKSNRLDLSPS